MIARDHRWRVVGVVASCVVLAACGSQVPPKEFVGAQGGLAVGNGNVGPGGGTGTAAANGGGTGLGTGTGTGGGSTGGGSTGGGSTGGGSTGGGSTGGGSTGGGSHPGGPVAGVKAGSCAGFKNGQGITSSTITIANVADLSGPVPQLFKSAQTAVTAYAAYFNQTSSICGRKLKVTGLDSATSESGDQQAASSACSSAFAMVGSMGAFDAGGADTVTRCGIPDIRAASTETARQKTPVSYGAYSLSTSEVPTSPFDYFKRIGGDAYKHAAFVYLDAGASSLNARSFIAAEEKMGYKFIYKQAINVAGGLIPYDSYATKMASAGVKYVQYIGAAAPYAQQLKAAIDNESKNNSGFKPMFVMDPTAYDTHYTSAGSSVNGTYVFNAGPLFEEANRNPQLSAYLQWLQRTSGGAPTFFGTYAWSAAALFTQLAIQLGGKLTRASLLAAVRQVHNFTNSKMVPPQDVAGKHTPKCLSVIQLVNGKWVRKTPYPYTCGSVVNSGVS